MIPRRTLLAAGPLALADCRIASADSQFTTGSSYSRTGWTHPKYDRMLTRANELIDPGHRMHALASCERYLMAALPVLPQFFDASSYLQKPYVHVGGGNPFDTQPFKYVWIDTNWRPQ